MPFSQIISRSFDIAWRNRSLWVLGMLFAFFGGGGVGSGGGNIGGQFQGVNPSQTPDGPFPRPDMPAWFTLENMILFGSILLVVVIVLGLIWLALQSIAHTGLIYGSDKAIDEQPAGWRALWRAGRNGPWKPLFWLKFLVRFVPGLLFGLIGLVVALTVALPMASTLFEQGPVTDEQAAGQFFQGIAPFLCLIPCFVILVLLVFWILSLIENYAARAIVLEGLPLRAAWSQGWQLLRSRMVDSFVMSVILGVLLTIAGFIVAIPLFILLALMAVPAFFLFQNLATIPPAALIGGGIVAALLFGILGAVLSGPLLAFDETVWTMAYRYLRGREVPSAKTTPAAV